MATRYKLLTSGPNVREAGHGWLPPRVTDGILPGPASGGGMRHSLGVIAITLTLALTPTTARAQAADTGWVTTDTMIPARDGVRLHTVIVAPKNVTTPLPILMDRTPYGAKGFATGLSRGAAQLGLGGYIYVLQDIPRPHGPEATLHTNRPPHPAPPPTADTR